MEPHRDIASFARPGLADDPLAIAEHPFAIAGKACAAWLAERLGRQPETTSLGAPKPEDWGWRVDAELETGWVAFVLSPDADAEEDGSWTLHVLPATSAGSRQARSLARAASMQGVLAAHEALRSDPLVKRLRWRASGEIAGEEAYALAASP